MGAAMRCLIISGIRDFSKGEKVVDKFGNDANDVYAILIDRRIARLHPIYMSVKEQLNGAGDFVNYFLHTENTAFIGKNCFVKIYKNVSE